MAIIDQVKRKLNITWDDDDTNKRLDDIIASAEVVLKRKLGISADVEYDFAIAGAENMLFLSLCLYEWNHATNDFDENYANEIAQCRAIHEVAHFLETEGETDEST